MNDKWYNDPEVIRTDDDVLQAHADWRANPSARMYAALQKARAASVDATRRAKARRNAF